MPNPFSTDFTVNPQWGSKGIEKLRSMEAAKQAEKTNGKFETNDYQQPQFDVNQAERTIQQSTHKEIRDWLSTPESYHQGIVL